MIAIDRKRTGPTVDKIINQACAGSQRPVRRHDGVVPSKYYQVGQKYRPSSVAGAPRSVPVSVEGLRQRAREIEAQQEQNRRALAEERRTYGTFQLPPHPSH